MRDLKESVTEELFAKGIGKLNQDDFNLPNGATNGSLRRILLIRNRLTNKSMGFGFAEYHGLEDAKAAYAKAQELEDKCTISSKPVTVSYPHNGVFPHAEFGTPESNPRFTFDVPGSSMTHKYRDERYYASVYMVNTEPPHGYSSPAKSPEPKSSPGDDERAASETKAKSKKRKAPGPAVSSHLQNWQNKAAELREAAGVQLKAVGGPSQAAGDGAIDGVSSSYTGTSHTYTRNDDERKRCYLCNTQLKTSELLQRHVKESKLHAANLTDEQKVSQAHERMKKARILIETTMTVASTAAPELVSKQQHQEISDSAQYTDRAALRRREEAQSIPSINLKQSSSNKISAEPSVSMKPGKGLGMLQKAGWSQGSGLGDGSGITAPIATDLYAAGVGLGHTSSRLGDAVEEAERVTRGDRGAFLEKTKENARKRYENLH